MAREERMETGEDKSMKYTIYNDDCLERLDKLEENSIDNIVTDPPYELNFMSKGWDNAGISFQKETWEKCLRVLKPGGYLLAFGGSRTFHRIACAIEDAGFEIRDTIMWLYGSGFPKSMDISKSLDKRNGRNEKKFKELGNYLKEKIIDTDNICAEKIGFSPALVRFWKLGERIPNKETWIKLKNIYDLNNDFDWLIEREEVKREIIANKKTKDFSKHNGSMMSFTTTDDYKTDTTNIDITIPSTDLAKQWQGWGTALKPSFEPIIVARKPFKGSLVDNVIEYGVGVINIDECRIGTEERTIPIHSNDKKDDNTMFNLHPTIQHERILTTEGRFPANTILTYNDTDFYEVCGGLPNTKQNGNIKKIYDKSQNVYGKYPPAQIWNSYNDSGSASRYYYCAKASAKDRDDGLEAFNQKKVNDGRQTPIDNAFQRGETLRKNTHPTVKPTELMQYLIRLVSPKGATILDPFMGSGSTGKAVMFENKERQANYTFIGIEKEKEYCDIAKARIKWAEDFKIEKYNDNQLTFDEILEAKDEI